MNDVDNVNRHPRLLDVGEAARMLRVSRGYVYRQVAAGRLPALRIGDSSRAPVRIDSDDLAAWLEAVNR